ncbi:MAG: DsbA family protein [Alphaproteobacteria bacterium]
MRVLSYFIAAAAGAAIAAAVLLHLPFGRGAGDLSAGQSAAVEALIARYLETHPEAVAKAIDQLQEREKSSSRDATRTAIRAKGDALFHDPADQILGNADGDVTIVEFFDYRCPYCKHALPGLLETLKADGHIRLVLKEFPILGANSVLASRAAIASVKQGKYAAFHVALLNSTTTLDEGNIMAIAETVGLDTTRLAADMKDPAVEAVIKKTYELAQDLKIEGTPAFIIGDELVPGAVDRKGLEQLVKEVRGKS